MKINDENEKYTKEFDTWNCMKKDTDNLKDYLPLYHERQVRWCKLGVNIGFEQDGTGDGFSRPVLILKGFSRHVCWIVPLTTSKKKNKYHIPLGIIDGRESFAIISQIRLVDVKRLYLRIDTVSEDLHKKVKNAIKALL